MDKFNGFELNGDVGGGGNTYKYDGEKETEHYEILMHHPLNTFKSILKANVRE